MRLIINKILYRDCKILFLLNNTHRLNVCWELNPTRPDVRNLVLGRAVFCLSFVARKRSQLDRSSAQQDTEAFAAQEPWDVPGRRMRRTDECIVSVTRRGCQLGLEQAPAVSYSDWCTSPVYGYLPHTRTTQRYGVALPLFTHFLWHLFALMIKLNFKYSLFIYT